MPTPTYHQISEANHRHMNPFSAEKIQLIGEICGLRPEQTILDLACGKGEMLCQWSSRFGIKATGVDSQAPFLDVAKQRSEELNVSDRLSFVQAEAAGYLKEHTETFDLVSCIGATFVGGGFSGTLAIMKPARKGSDSLLLVGEPFWLQPPPADANTGWGESSSLESILEQSENADLEIIEMVLANDDDFDRYEASQWKAISDWLHDNPNAAVSQEYSEQMKKRRLNYLRNARSYLGWGIFVLRERCSTSSRTKACTAWRSDSLSLCPNRESAASVPKERPDFRSASSR